MHAKLISQAVQNSENLATPCGSDIVDTNQVTDEDNDFIPTCAAVH